MKRTSVIILIVSLLLNSQIFAQGASIDSLFHQFDLKPNKKLSSQLVDSFSSLDLYDYPIQRKYHSNESFLYMLTYLGMANYSYTQGKFHSSERFSNAAISYINPDSLRWLSSCYEVLNVSQQRIGKYQEAFVNTKNDYDIGIKLNDYQILSSALNSLAAINIATGHPQEALNYIDEAINIEREHNVDGKKSLSVRLGIKTEILMALDKPEEALDCINEALEIDQENGRINKYHIRLSQKADILISQQKWTECKNLCLDALNFFKDNDDIVNEIIVLKQLGVCEMSTKQYESAEKYLLEGEKLCKQINFRPLLWRIQEQLSKLYKVTHKTDKAIKYLQSSFNIKDSLNTEKYQNLLSEYHVAYETQLKDEQIKEQKTRLHRQIRFGVVLILLLALSIILTIVYSRLARLLKLSNEVLEENSRIRNRIFSIVSHDLRNPVNAQKQMLDYICNFYDDISDTDRRNITELIHKSNDSLSDLLVNLLEWASLESGRLVFNPVRADLNSVITSEIRQLHTLCTRKNVEIKSSVIPDTFVYSDINFLEIIIRNLLVNAIKFSNVGGIVELKTEDSSEYITVSITDYGKGMLPEEQNLIFKKEFVTTPGTSGETGTGIGLMVCKELVEKNGGKIGFTSEHLKGSTFYFTVRKIEAQPK